MPNSKPPATEDVMGYQVAIAGINTCVDDIAHWVGHGNECRWLACINPHSYVVALSNQPFSAALQAADWLVPDGAGIVLASRVLGGRIHERVTGSDVFAHLNRLLNAGNGASVFFLGATAETLHDVRSRLAREYPNIRFAGSYAPPFADNFSEVETTRMVDMINAATPDILWVGLTSPKQDLWLHQNHAKLNVKFAAGIGAVFDFYAGRVKRSHPFFQRLGLEWLPRLIQEPRRLWRRNFVSTPLFLAHLLMARLNKKGQT